jgi:hypothetical protein
MVIADFVVACLFVFDTSREKVFFLLEFVRIISNKRLVAKTKRRKSEHRSEINLRPPFVYYIVLMTGRDLVALFLLSILAQPASIHYPRLKAFSLLTFLIKRKPIGNTSWPRPVRFQDERNILFQFSLSCSKILEKCHHIIAVRKRKRTRASSECS